jgi:hypothetical protein
VIKAINNLDLKQLSLENVELLQKMVPTEQEQKGYKEYVIEKKDLNLLTEEDKFMLQLTKIERLSSKLSIMSYIGNFFDSLHLISPVRHFNCGFIFCQLILLFYYYFTANLCNNLGSIVRETIEEVQIRSRDHLSLWKLSKQQQAWTSVWFQTSKFRHITRHQVQ